MRACVNVCAHMDVNIYTPTHTHIHIHIYINSDMVPGIVYQNEECPRSAENKEKRKKTKKQRKSNQIQHI